MRRCLAHALRLPLAVLLLVATPLPGRAAAVTYLLVRSIPVGILPDALVVDTPAHRLFVANTGSQVLSTTYTNQLPQEAYRNTPGSLSVIDTQTNTVVATIPTDVWPLELALDPARQRLYVLCADALPIHLSAASGLPMNMKPTLDVIDARTLQVLARRLLPVVLPANTTLPFYPLHVMTLDPASNHLLLQAYSQVGASEAAAADAYLYDAASLRVLRTYPAPPQGTLYASQTPTPLLLYVVYRALPTPTTTSSTTTTLVGQPRLLNLASGLSARLRDVVLFRSWGGPLPHYGKDLTWSGEIRDVYVNSAVSRLFVLTAYSAEYQRIAGPPYTLGIYNLQTGTLLHQLIFADGPPQGQQAVAFDGRLGRYYALGTTPDPKDPKECAAAVNIVTGDLRTGAVVHTTPGKGQLAVVLADPTRHVVYAASGNGVEEGLDILCTDPSLVRADAGVVQAIDGRTGATLATVTLPSHTMTPPGGPTSQVPGQVAAMALDPTTGTVYAVDGHGGNVVYVISLKRL